MELASLVIGLITGLLVGGTTVFFLRRGNSTAAKELETTRCELQAYRQEVSEHYLKTADLVDRLTQDYKGLFEHLNDGAHKHMEPDLLRRKLAGGAAPPVVLGLLGQPWSADGSAPGTSAPTTPDAAKSDPSASAADPVYDGPGLPDAGPADRWATPAGEPLGPEAETDTSKRHQLPPDAIADAAQSDFEAAEDERVRQDAQDDSDRRREPRW